MATSVTATGHGVRVVTHIMPLESPAPPCPTKSKEKEDDLSIPYMTRMFLKGEPVALGTVQVFIGLVILAMGVIILVTGNLHGAIPMGLGISCVISGSVTLAARRGTCLRQIKSTLALNVIALMLAVAGICHFCIELANRSDPMECSGGYWECDGMLWRYRNLMDGMNGMMLVFSVLEVCVCITLVVFSYKACLPHDSVNKMVVKVHEAGQVCKSSEEALLKEGEDEPPAYVP